LSILWLKKDYNRYNFKFQNLTVKGSFTRRIGPIWNEDSDILRVEQDRTNDIKENTSRSEYKKEIQLVNIAVVLIGKAGGYFVPKTQLPKKHSSNREKSVKA